MEKVQSVEVKQGTINADDIRRYAIKFAKILKAGGELIESIVGFNYEEGKEDE